MIQLLLAIIYLAFISLGLPDSLLGSAWPIMHEELQVPLSYAGIISMIIATIAMIVIMGIANYFITPYYYGGAAMKEVVVQLMPFILLFNLIKGVANSVITFVIYKRISPFLHKQ